MYVNRAICECVRMDRPKNVKKKEPNIVIIFNLKVMFQRTIVIGRVEGPGAHYIGRSTNALMSI